MIDRATFTSMVQERFPTVVVGDESGDIALTVGRMHLTELAGWLRDRRTSLIWG